MRALRETRTTPVTTRGTVVDAATGESLPGAHVYALRDGNPVGTTTTVAGEYSFEFVPGETVHVSFVGYEPEQFTADGSTWVHRLQPGVPLDEFEVVADRPKHYLGGLLLAALAFVLGSRSQGSL